MKIIFFLVSLKFILCLQLYATIEPPTTKPSGNWSDIGNYSTLWYSDLAEVLYINSAEELAGMAYLSSKGNTFEGKQIELKADIDLQAHYWNKCHTFNGTFNGNGYTIKNLQYSFDMGIYTSRCDAGLMDCIGVNGNVKNLNIRNLSIDIKIDIYHDLVVGGLSRENNGIINNCSISGDISLKYIGNSFTGGCIEAGGIVYRNNNLIINSGNHVNIICVANPHSKDSDAIGGGVAGLNYGKIINCFNRGAIMTSVGYNSSTSTGLNPYKSTAYSGGIAGVNFNCIENCYNSADIKSSVHNLGNLAGMKAYAGGICNYESNVINCYYTTNAIINAPNVTSCNGSYAVTPSELLSKVVDLMNEYVRKNLNNYSEIIDEWIVFNDFNDNYPITKNQIDKEAKVPELIIIDKVDLTNIPTKANVSYRRTFYKGWNSMCVPFAFDKTVLNQFLKDYKIVIYNDMEVVGNTKQFVFKQVESVSAGTPCLIYTPIDVECTFLLKEAELVNRPDNSTPLKGSFIMEQLGKGYYKLTSDGTFFSRTKSDEATITPFRIYIDTDN